MTAITSTSFCPAAWKAFILILASAGRFAVSNFLGSAIMWVGRAFTTFTTAGIGYIMVAFIPSVEQHLSSPFMPVMIIGMMAFVISGLFLSLFSFSLDTILLCFLVDEGWAQHQGHETGKNRPKELNDFAKRKAGFQLFFWCCC